MLGFVRSEADSWRSFWTRRETPAARLALNKSPSSVGRDIVPCVAPEKECHCSLCAHRHGTQDRAGAHPSQGEGGVWDNFSDFDKQSSVNAESASGVGTRVCGVVRVRSESASEGIARLCDSLCNALAEARNEESIMPEDTELMAALLPVQNAHELGLFDVMWHEHASPRSSAADSGSLTLSPEGRQLTRSLSLPRTPRSSSPSTPRLSSGRPSSPRPSSGRPSTNSPRGARASSPSSAVVSAMGNSGHQRPLHSNPHSVLLLDVHTRLLRTSGSSVSAKILETPLSLRPAHS